MKVPWKIVGLAGVAGVTAATGVVVARKHRDHTDYDPDELRDKLHSRVADAADDDPEVAAEAEAFVDEPAPWQGAAEADTAVHTSPHGDDAAEAPADGDAAEAPADGDAAPEAPADEPAA
jgi:hypothetical protein